MTITTGHFTLTSAQRLFKDALSNYPRLMGYWDFDKRDCNIDGGDRGFEISYVKGVKTA